MKKTAHFILDKAIEYGWCMDKMHLASTGSIYIELYRNQKNQQEYVVIRVADHEIEYKKYLKTYSVSPTELSQDEVINILNKKFGQVGDVFDLGNLEKS